ncbi:hypothetical protein HDU98_007134 [Podochytrium sp. JEL0797]|nr:hypothetical protein HDU98_007134 [Podochytrium sp. JEL0797]
MRESAKELFVKSGLSLEVLSRIWNLVDPQTSMQLNLAQFMLAMLIITQMKSGALQSVPPSIPPALLTAIATAAQSALSQAATPSSGPIPGSLNTSPPSKPFASIPAVVSPVRTGSIGIPSGVAPPPAFDKRRSMMQKTPTGGSSGGFGDSNEVWAIQPDEKALSDSHFENLDVGKKGFVSGQDSYAFFLKSQLDQATLAQIWDLANVSKSVGLSKDEFSVAMRLIKVAMTGEPLPSTLPANLIPPALRTGVASPAPLAAAAIAPQSAQQDLMGLSDAFATSTPPLPPAVPQPAAVPQPNPAFDIRRFSTLNASKGINGSVPSLTDDRSSEITSARTQLSDLQQKRDMLAPMQETLRAKRAANDIELQKVLLQKQELTLELTQASATYEAECEILAENMGVLQREQQVLEMQRADVEQAKLVVQAKADEKNQVVAAIEAVKAEIADCLVHLREMETVTRQYQEEIAVMRPRFTEAHADLKKQLNLVEINKQLLTSVTEEYTQLKADLGREETSLEEEKRRLGLLSNQVAVQTAINDKERARVQVAAAHANEARSLSASHADSLNNLEVEAARGFDAPVGHAVMSQSPVQVLKPELVAAPVAPVARARPPPPPVSRSLDKRSSITASTKSVEGLSDVLPAPAPSPVPAGSPPPMPPMFTKPKAGGSVGDHIGEAVTVTALAASVSNAAPASDFNFDADFDSAFAAVPLSPSKKVNDASAFDDVFSSFPAASAVVDSKAFEDAFSIPSEASKPVEAASNDAFASVEDAFAIPSAAPKPVETAAKDAFEDAFSTPAAAPKPVETAAKDIFSSAPPATAQTRSFEDAFAVPSVTPPAPTSAPVSDAFVLPPPPKAAVTFSTEGLDKVRRASTINSFATGDDASIRSASRKTRINKLKTIDADSEFANAFGGLATTATSTTSAGVPEAGTPVAAIIDESVFDAIPKTDDFSFDSAFAAPPVRSAAVKGDDAFGGLENAFESLASITPVAKTPVDHETISTTPLDATKSAFDAFDVAFDLTVANGAAVGVANGGAKAAAVFDGELNAAFGGPVVAVEKKTVASGSAVKAEAVASGSDVKAVAVGTVKQVVVAQEAKTEAVVAPAAPVAAKEAGEEMEEVKELMSLGFSKEQCVAALEKNEFDVTKASNCLLDGPP